MPPSHQTNLSAWSLSSEEEKERKIPKKVLSLKYVNVHQKAHSIKKFITQNNKVNSSILNGISKVQAAHES